MLFFRKILAVVIALALAFSPVAVAAGSVHSDNASTVSMTSAAAVAMGSMSMGADAAMADCEKWCCGAFIVVIQCAVVNSLADQVIMTYHNACCVYSKKYKYR